MNAADNDQYVDLILLIKAISFATGLSDQYADVFRLILGDFTVGNGLSGDLLGALEDLVRHSSGISRELRAKHA